MYFIFVNQRFLVCHQKLMRLSWLACLNSWVNFFCGHARWCVGVLVGWRWSLGPTAPSPRCKVARGCSSGRGFRSRRRARGCGRIAAVTALVRAWSVAIVRFGLVVSLAAAAALGSGLWCLLWVQLAPPLQVVRRCLRFRPVRVAGLPLAPVSGPRGGFGCLRRFHIADVGVS